MKLTDFKVLTFDVVGTLIDFERGVLTSVRRLGGPAAKDLSDDQIFEPYLRGRAAFPGRSSREMANVYLSLARELGLPDDTQSAAAFQRDVLDWPAFPDSVEALRRLRKHFRLVAMTNADRVALSAYAHTLGDPFDDTVCCDETGVAKPDPQFFAYNRGRQAAFGFKFHEILHTAQSQYHDIGIATELGYATCWIERRRGQEGFGGTPSPAKVTAPTFCYSTLAALADAVEVEFAVA
ncbi:HAD-IA family hydrolase [Burkholderia semiarida]|uniref:HAD-IA family hydrolase n=1 Tax=Burkholderia TaxID=32008 RepID=UPI00265DF0CA|nr:HAD-IA family hydrolase [Burkholderia sp. AU44665]MDN7697297.1 HAD-IA family hydrolase [Burkholderia sp. AU44665]